MRHMHHHIRKPFEFLPRCSTHSDMILAAHLLMLELIDSSIQPSVLIDLRFPDSTAATEDLCSTYCRQITITTQTKLLGSYCLAIFDSWYTFQGFDHLYLVTLHATCMLQPWAECQLDDKECFIHFCYAAAFPFEVPYYQDLQNANPYSLTPVKSLNMGPKGLSLVR